jgi:alginate O-acetyltransferase complex protein AlgJ
MSELLERSEPGKTRAGAARAQETAPGRHEPDRSPECAECFGSQHRRIAWLVAALLTVGFMASVGSLAIQIHDGASFDLRGWRDGSLGRSVDRALDVPYARSVQRAQAALRYRVFGDMGLQVKEGCPGWLFYADGLRPPPVAAAKVRHTGIPGQDVLLDARIASLKRYAAALQRERIQLVVVTVPDKARVESRALCGLRQDARMSRRLDAWRRALAEAGVVDVDLLPVLNAVQPAYFRTDVHWNAQGAQAAASAVGKAVLPLMGGLGRTRFTTGRGPREDRVGDLLVLAGLDEVPNGWRPTPDSVTPETIRAQHRGGLLDDGPVTEIVLAGSSFSRRSGFAERLGEQLGREVWNVSLDDGQFDRALQAIWSQRAAWPTTVRAVIWELSEDALSAPLPPATAGPGDGTGTSGTSGTSGPTSTTGAKS